MDYSKPVQINQNKQKIILFVIVNLHVDLSLYVRQFQWLILNQDDSNSAQFAINIRKTVLENRDSTFIKQDIHESKHTHL